MYFSHTKNVSVFLHTQKYYVIHAKITSIFTIQKLLCITRTQKLPYKNVSVFLHTQKILCNPRKNY